MACHRWTTSVQSHKVASVVKEEEKSYVCSAGFFVRRLGRGPGDVLVAFPVGPAAEGDLVGMVLPFG